jgi:CBS domain-containing protein
MKLLRDVAIRHLVTVAPGSSLRRAAKVMCDRGVGCAVVIDKEAVAGIITERDLLHAVAEDKVMDDALVEDVMTPDVVSGAPGWDVLKAVNTMVEGGFRHLLITEMGDPIGIVSLRTPTTTSSSRNRSEAPVTVLWPCTSKPSIRAVPRTTSGTRRGEGPSAWTISGCHRGHVAGSNSNATRRSEAPGIVRERAISKRR